MSTDRDQMMFDIQSDLGQIKREQTSQGLRLSSIEDHVLGAMTSIYGIQTDVADLKVRVDRIERRLGLSGLNIDASSEGRQNRAFPRSATPQALAATAE